MKTFLAKYPGDCNQCFDFFEAGDEIGYIDDEICCAICCEASEDDPFS